MASSRTADPGGDCLLDPAQRLFRLADGRPLPRAACPQMVRGAGRHRSAGLEAVHARARRLQRRAVHLRLRRALPAADRAVEPARLGHARADDDLQHGHILYDQHQSAALFGRPVVLEFQPDLFHPAEHVSVGLGRLLRARRNHPRLPRRSDGRQLLRRYVARRHLHLCAGLADFRRHLHAAGHADDLRQHGGRHHPRAGLDGPRRQGPGEAADDRRRPGRGGHPDQDARHQRRRLLRHERRPSAREPDRDDQLLHHAGDDDVPVRAGADVRAHARAHPPLGRHLRRHAGHDDRAHRLGHPHRHDGAEPRPHRARCDGLPGSVRLGARTASSTFRARPSRPCRSTSISATSRARSFASAPRPARRSRRSPPTSPAARSMPRWTA